jgi:uncharacterized protein with HEPN domain
MSDDLLLVITPLRKALERIQRKAEPLLAKPNLLETEEGEDLLDVICMQFLAAGEALKRLEKLQPGLLPTSFPDIDWRGAMGFRDVIAHQYFDLDAEQVLLICRDALPGVLAAIRSLERTIQAGETEGQQTAGQQSQGQHTEPMGLGL